MRNSVRLSRAVGVVLGFCLALAVGCSDEAPALPAAPAAGEAQVLASWSAVTNAAAVKATVLSGEATPPARADWDFTLPCDLRLWPGVQFDF